MSLTTHIGFGPFQLKDFEPGDLFARFDGSLAKVCKPQPSGRPEHLQVWTDFGTANARKEWLHRTAQVYAISEEQAWSIEDQRKRAALIPLHVRGETLRLRIVAGRYSDGNLLVRLIDGDGTPYFKASLTFPGLELAEGEFAFKTYSENEGLLEATIAAGVVAQTGRSVVLNSHAGSAPVCRLLPPYEALCVRDSR